MIKTFANFGYGGEIVSVDVDMKEGEPSLDIVGVADSEVKDLKERIKAAILNSGFSLPSKKVMITLNPCDIRKDVAASELAIALAILTADNTDTSLVPVVALGALSLSGEVQPVKGVYNAMYCIQNNEDTGHRFIIPENSEKSVPEAEVCRVANLKEAYNAVCKGMSAFKVVNGYSPNDYEVCFSPISSATMHSVDSTSIRQGLLYAISVAVAGRFNMLAYGSRNSGKSDTMQLAQYLQPNLLMGELPDNNRILSVAGLAKPNGRAMARPFRVPHQTATIEGMCGGGVNASPGEITLAHNGILFLDEAPEFKTSVLQMLRVPLQNKNITISRGGKSTTYPADFRLFMTADPCPCGCYKIQRKLCICSEESRKLYWEKLNKPLLNKIAIRYNCDKIHNVPFRSIEVHRQRIAQAYKHQLARQDKFNSELTHDELSRFRRTSDAAAAIQQMTDLGCSQEYIDAVLRIAVTISDMQTDNESIQGCYVASARRLYDDLPVEIK